MSISAFDPKPTSSIDAAPPFRLEFNQYDALSSGGDMRRRNFITALGSAVAWPVVARAQQPGRTRRIGVLHPLAANDPIAKARLSAFQDGLAQLGWTDGRNVNIEFRWSAGIEAETRR